MTPKRQYQAYLIRFQRADGQAQWRVTVQDAQNGEQRCFASERELLRFLLRVLADGTAAPAPSPPDDGPSGGDRSHTQ